MIQWILLYVPWMGLVGSDSQRVAYCVHKELAQVVNFSDIHPRVCIFL